MKRRLAGFVLGADLASRHGGLALLRLRSGKLWARRFDIRNDHSARMLPAFAELLKNAGAQVPDVAAYGITSGPGSFTGLRVALAAIRGFTLEAPRPVWGFGTLEAMAEAFIMGHPEAGPWLAPVLDAGRGEIYSALYRVQETGTIRQMESLRLWKPSEWLRVQRAKRRPLDVFGNGIAAVETLWNGKPPSRWFADGAHPACAEACARMAAERYARGENAPPLELAYVRPPDIR